MSGSVAVILIMHSIQCDENTWLLVNLGLDNTEYRDIRIATSQFKIKRQFNFTVCKNRTTVFGIVCRNATDTTPIPPYRQSTDIADLGPSRCRNV